MSDIRIVHAFAEGEEGELIEELKQRIDDLKEENLGLKFGLDEAKLNYTENLRHFAKKNEVLCTRLAEAERDYRIQNDAIVAHLDKEQALLAENRLLMETLERVDDLTIGWGDLGTYHKAVSRFAAIAGVVAREKRLAPLTAAEVERVKGLEVVAEAAQVIQGYEDFESNFGKLGKALDAALAALEVVNQ